jgi:hypothetical protein
MAKDEFLQEFEQALTQIAVGKVKLKVLKMQARLHLQPKAIHKIGKAQVKNRIDEFIDSHPELEPEDIEFLRKGEVGTIEVAKFLTDNNYLEISPKTVARNIGTWYRPGKSDDRGHGKKRMVDTISVIERHLIYGDSEKKQHG